MLLSLEIFLIISGVMLRLLVSGGTAGTGLNVLVGLLIWLALLLHFARKNDFAAETQSLILWLTAVFGCLIVWGFLIAPYKFGAFPYAFAWITDIILFYLVIRLDRPYLFAGIFAGTAVLIAFYGLYQHLWGLESLRQAIAQDPNLLDFIPLELRTNFQDRLYSNEPFGTFTYQNSLGGFLVLTLPIILSFYSATKVQAASGINKMILYLCSLHIFVISIFGLIILYVLWSTGSKGAWVATAVGLALFGILSYVTPSRRRIFLVIVLICFAGGFIYLISEPPPSLTVRYGYWRSAGEIIKHNPMGVGINQFADHYLMYRGANTEVTQKAHNDFIQIGAELGIIALVIFIIIFAGILVRGLKFILGGDGDFRRKSLLIGLFCGLAGFLLHSTVDFNFYVQGLSMSAWLTAGCIVAMVSNKPGTAPGQPAGRLIPVLHLTIIFILFIIVMTISAVICPRLMEYDTLLQEGQALVRSGDRVNEEQGIFKLEQARNINPYAVEPYLELAFWNHRNICPAQSHKIPPVCTHLMDKAIALSPMSAMLYDYQAGFYDKHFNPGRSEYYLRKAEQLNPYKYK